MKLDALEAIATYWNLIPNDDKKDPTEDPKADEKFSRWLRDSSVWVPLKTFLKAKPDELVAAGYPEGTVKSFLDAYRELEQAEARKARRHRRAGRDEAADRIAIAGRIGRLRSIPASR